MIDQQLNELIAREGGYVNDARDAGGETNWGITIAVARANGYTGPMRSLPRDTAKEIYRRIYWLKPGFDQISAHAPRVAEELFDTGVNMGPAVAATFLQRALTALNRNGKDFPDLVPDGNAGAMTRSALQAFLRARGSAGEIVLVRALNCLQGVRYIELAERRGANEAFLYGWLSNRVS